jgi:hypothetical protein
MRNDKVLFRDVTERAELCLQGVIKVHKTNFKGQRTFPWLILERFVVMCPTIPFGEIFPLFRRGRLPKEFTKCEGLLVSRSG